MIFGGRSFFGMNARRSLGRAPRTQVALTVSDAEIEHIEACESAPGELVRKRQPASQQEEQQQWTRRGLFKIGFNVCSPRVRGARKFTK